MDLIEVLSDLKKFGLVQTDIRDVKPLPDMSKFDKNEGSDIELDHFDHYYIKELCDDGDTWGDIYLPTKYSDGDGGVLYVEVTFFN